LLGCKVLVGNSSVGIRECSFLGVPVVNIGTRQQGRERAKNVVDVSHAADAILEAVELLQQPWITRHGSTLYGDGHAGERIAGILAGAELRRVA
jgi:UDP-N-acetylglucosamine 2-epimerase